MMWLYTIDEAMWWLLVILATAMAEEAGLGGFGGSEKEQKYLFRR
jgi:hypothetical protein